MGLLGSTGPGSSPVLEDRVDDLLVVMEDRERLSRHVAGRGRDGVRRAVGRGDPPGPRRAADPVGGRARRGSDPTTCPRRRPRSRSRRRSVSSVASRTSAEWAETRHGAICRRGSTIRQGRTLGSALRARGLGRGLVPGPADVLRDRPASVVSVDPHADARSCTAPGARRCQDPERPVLGGTDAERYLIELEGDDYFPWAGDQDAVIEEIQEFLTGERTAPETRPCPRRRSCSPTSSDHGEGGRDRRPCLARARRRASRRRSVDYSSVPRTRGRHRR